MHKMHNMHKRNKPLTAKEHEARRQNAKKSTGPRTELGKERVRANAVKSGYHADKIAYQAMIALGEDPKEYAATYAIVYEHMAPQNEGQVLMVEDVAIIRWQQNRNQRGQAGLIGEQLEELTRRRSKQWLTYEESLDDAPQEQVIAHGIASLPHSKGKLERISDLLEIALEQAKKGQYGEADAALTMIYGKESDSMHTARLRNRIQDLQKDPDGATAREVQKLLLYGLEEEQRKWNRAWREHLETMRPPSQAEINACFVPKGKAWRALQRQAASLDQRLEKKMRLYWDTQQKDRERLLRRSEEEKLEATPEEAAADQEAKEFLGKLMGLINETNVKLKAAAEARRAAAAGETGSTGAPTGEAPEVTDSPSKTVDRRENSNGQADTTKSTASQKPAGSAGVPTREPRPAAEPEVSEQSEAMVENQGQFPKTNRKQS
ncbi:MAG TPA: hypothetical protein VMO17_03195 [Terriglobia bacterium]|nr:hypothetical protein [Terriglobia bacterium]